MPQVYLDQGFGSRPVRAGGPGPLFLPLPNGMRGWEGRGEWAIGGGTENTLAAAGPPAPPPQPVPVPQPRGARRGRGPGRRPREGVGTRVPPPLPLLPSGARPYTPHPGPPGRPSPPWPRPPAHLRFRPAPSAAGRSGAAHPPPGGLFGARWLLAGSCSSATAAAR